ncbi:hypothetical protein Hanom_Chr09g00793131 [Helianthus anomalus]
MFVHQVLNGVTILVNKQVKDEDSGATDPTVVTGCASMVKSDHALPLDHTTIALVSLKDLNIADRMKSSPKKVEKLSNPLTSGEIVNLEIILEGSTQKDINRFLDDQTSHLKYAHEVKLWNTVLFQKLINGHEWEDRQIQLIRDPSHLELKYLNGSSQQ